MRAMSDVTQILSKIESGDREAAEQLLPLVYNELRKLAAALLAKGRGAARRRKATGHVSVTWARA